MQTCVGSFFYIGTASPSATRQQVKLITNSTHDERPSPPYTLTSPQAPLYSLDISITEASIFNHIALREKAEEFFIKNAHTLLRRN